MHLATIGYSGWTPEALRATIHEMGAMCLDIRLAPTSRHPAWRKAALRTLLGAANYVHMPGLGNINAFTGGPITLNAPEQAVAPVRRLLAQRPVVLLCGCADVRSCHRLTAAEYLAAQIPGIIVTHLEPPAPTLAAGEMLAISLWQPYAALIAVEAVAPGMGKRIETRSWATSYRGWLAIHATRTPGDLGESGLAALCADEPVRTALAFLGYQSARDLPRGAVQAIAWLADCVPTEVIYPTPAPGDPNWHVGDYTPGRFGWVLEHIQRIDPPIPARGAQRLWRWAMPLEIRDVICGQSTDR